MRHFACCVVFIAILTGCSAGYEVASVTRTRILIDHRFDTPKAAEAVAFLEPYRHKVDSMMSPVVGRTATYMAAERPESRLSNLMADILVWDARRYGDPVDIAVYNMGGIRAALPEGNVTIGDLLEVAPFENKLCVVTLTGDRLQQLFSEIASTGGEAVSHGVELCITKKGCLVSARVNGQAVDPQRSYRIATIDYVAQGNDGMTAFKHSSRLNMPQRSGESIRSDINEYFRELTRSGKVAQSSVEGRIKIVEDKR